MAITEHTSQFKALGTLGSLGGVALACMLFQLELQSLVTSGTSVGAPDMALFL
jgi:hypothetical protein